MNPIKNKCWSCDHCDKVFRFTDHGKLEAEQCCKCISCHTSTYMEYIGVSNYRCKKCSLEESIPKYEESMLNLIQRLKSAKNEFKELTGNK